MFFYLECCLLRNTGARFLAEFETIPFRRIMAGSNGNAAAGLFSDYAERNERSWYCFGRQVNFDAVCR